MRSFIAIPLLLVLAILASPAAADIPGPGSDCTVEERSSKRVECVSCLAAECETTLGTEYELECERPDNGTEIWCRPDPDFEGGCASVSGSRGAGLALQLIVASVLAGLGLALFRRSRLRT